MNGTIDSLMKKTIAKVGVVGLVVLGISECHMIIAPAAIAEEVDIQTLSIEPHFGFIDQMMDHIDFKRSKPIIVEDMYPWLDPENASKQIEVDALKRILRGAGFEGYSLRMAQAIIRLESNRRIYAHNTNANTGDNSYGLFQINMFRDLEAQRLEQYGLPNNEALFNPLVNARVAWDISDGGTNWSAWTTYPAAKKIIGNYSG